MEVRRSNRVREPQVNKPLHDGDPKLFAQEGLLCAATEEIWRVMNQQGVNKYQLSKRLGCSKAHVTMVLNGTRNMTLRTLSDLAGALGYEVTVKLKRRALPTSAEPR